MCAPAIRVPWTRNRAGREWQTEGVTDSSRYETDWLAIPDLVEVLGEPHGKVRRLLDEQYLVGSRRDGVLRVPSVFIVDGRPLSSLRGTIIVLHDAEAAAIPGEYKIYIE